MTRHFSVKLHFVRFAGYFFGGISGLKLHICNMNFTLLSVFWSGRIYIIYLLTKISVWKDEISAPPHLKLTILISLKPNGWLKLFLFFFSVTRKIHVKVTVFRQGTFFRNGKRRLIKMFYMTLQWFCWRILVDSCQSWVFSCSECKNLRTWFFV